MIVHWEPCYDHRPIVWTQSEVDKLVITHGGRTVAVDFSNAQIVEFALQPPVTRYVHRAWRVDGTLHLVMPSLGRLDHRVTIDYGAEEVISWRDRG